MSANVFVLLVYPAVVAVLALILYWVIRLAVRHALRDVGAGAAVARAEGVPTAPRVPRV